DDAPVLRQEARVMQADAVPHELLHLLAEGAVEACASERLVDRFLLLLRAEVDAHEILRFLRGGALREVHQVYRRAAGANELRERLVQRRLPVLEIQRYGPVRAGDDG